MLLSISIEIIDEKIKHEKGKTRCAAWKNSGKVGKLVNEQEIVKLRIELFFPWKLIFFREDMMYWKEYLFKIDDEFKNLIHFSRSTAWTIYDQTTHELCYNARENYFFEMRATFICFLHNHQRVDSLIIEYFIYFINDFVQNQRWP